MEWQTHGLYLQVTGECFIIWLELYHAHCYGGGALIKLWCRVWMSSICTVLLLWARRHFRVTWMCIVTPIVEIVDQSLLLLRACVRHNMCIMHMAVLAVKRWVRCTLLFFLFSPASFLLYCGTVLYPEGFAVLWELAGWQRTPASCACISMLSFSLLYRCLIVLYTLN